MNKGLFIILASLALSGCLKSATDYQRTPTAKLCMDYLTSSPRYFLTYGAQEEALYQRGEDCSEYVDEATKINAARAGAPVVDNNAALIKQGQEMMKNSTYTPAPPPNNNVRCYTQGNVTTCN